MSSALAIFASDDETFHVKAIIPVQTTIRKTDSRMSTIVFSFLHSYSPGHRESWRESMRFQWELESVGSVRKKPGFLKKPGF
ncbi:MAG: hypothetical protein CMJ78_23415 [Planctomycetaceae bacterium]|nr:hypothetical protein [Planctomycetaceae bacterium]